MIRITGWKREGIVSTNISEEEAIWLATRDKVEDNMDITVFTDRKDSAGKFAKGNVTNPIKAEIWRVVEERWLSKNNEMMKRSHGKARKAANGNGDALKIDIDQWKYKQKS